MSNEMVCKTFKVVKEYRNAMRIANEQTNQECYSESEIEIVDIFISHLDQELIGRGLDGGWVWIGDKIVPKDEIQQSMSLDDSQDNYDPGCEPEYSQDKFDHDDEHDG